MTFAILQLQTKVVFEAFLAKEEQKEETANFCHFQ